MNLPKINIETNKLDINTKFYFFLKYLVKANLTDNQILKLIEYHQIFSTNETLNQFKETILQQFSTTTKKGQKQIAYLTDIFIEIQDKNDLDVFIFSIKLILVKDLLLQEAKIKQAHSMEILKNVNPLSLEYDKITILNPYKTRVNRALLALIFFEKLNTGFSKETDIFTKNLAIQAQQLIKIGIEPNQIFMLLFNESINQSITSDSGADYENRILSVLISQGINENHIKKIHDKVDKSTEFDLFFELNSKTFGIGAKRTLRERYKQFIKTAQMTPIDVMIEITLGTDLTEEKVKSIVNHDIYLFVADEVYQQFDYLQKTEKVFSCKDLTIETLEKISIKSI